MALFVVLDTNHFQELRNNSPAGKRLTQLIANTGADVFCCIVAAEESLRGWLDFIRKSQTGLPQLEGYQRLHECLIALSKFTLLPFDQEAGEHFERLKKLLPRIGSMDLKIASICMAHGALLLSRNLRDFQLIPGLRVENWLEE